MNIVKMRGKTLVAMRNNNNNTNILSGLYFNIVDKKRAKIFVAIRNNTIIRPVWPLRHSNRCPFCLAWAPIASLFQYIFCSPFSPSLPFFLSSLFLPICASLWATKQTYLHNSYCVIFFSIFFVHHSLLLFSFSFFFVFFSN